MKTARSLPEEKPTLSWGPVSLRQLLGQVAAVEVKSPPGLKALRAAHLPAWKAYTGNIFSLEISRNEMEEMYKRWQQPLGTACPGEIMSERKKQQKLNHSQFQLEELVKQTRRKFRAAACLGNYLLVN